MRSKDRVAHRATVPQEDRLVLARGEDVPDASRDDCRAGLVTLPLRPLTERLRERLARRSPSLSRRAAKVP